MRWGRSSAELLCEAAAWPEVLAGSDDDFRCVWLRRARVVHSGGSLLNGLFPCLAALPALCSSSVCQLQRGCSGVRPAQALPPPCSTLTPGWLATLLCPLFCSRAGLGLVLQLVVAARGSGGGVAAAAAGASPAHPHPHPHPQPSTWEVLMEISAPHVGALLQAGSAAAGETYRALQVWRAGPWGPTVQQTCSAAWLGCKTTLRGLRAAAVQPQLAEATVLPSPTLQAYLGWPAPAAARALLGCAPRPADVQQLLSGQAPTGLPPGLGLDELVGGAGRRRAAEGKRECCRGHVHACCGGAH